MGRIIYPIYEMENKIPWFETTNQTFISGDPGSSLASGLSGLSIAPLCRFINTTCGGNMFIRLNGESSNWD